MALIRREKRLGEIIERSKREFADLYHHGVPTFVHQTLKVVDVNDCTYPWWNSNKRAPSRLRVG